MFHQSFQESFHEHTLSHANKSLVILLCFSYSITLPFLLVLLMLYLTIIIFASTFLLLVLSLVFYIVLGRLSDDRCNESKQSGISIIVAAKNESANLEKLITSLRKINFPADKFEVILVDDNSEDNTFSKAESLCNSLDNFHVIKSAKFENLSGKRAALTTGIEKARFENIVITDADCEVSPDWLKCYSEKFSEFDFIFGPAPLKYSNSMSGKLAAVENLKNHILIFVLTKLGLPYSAAARNFGFKKSVFNQLGGYTNTVDTLSGDDDLLLREAIKAHFKIGIITSSDSFVYSGTKQTFNEYLNQRARHTSASHHYLPGRKIILSLWHLLNLVVLFSFLLSPFNSIFVLPIFIKAIVDYLVTNSYQYKFGYDLGPVELVLLSLAVELLTPVHFLNSFRFKKRWS